MGRTAIVLVLATYQTVMALGLGSVPPQPPLLEEAAAVAWHLSRQRVLPGAEQAFGDGSPTEPLWLSVALFAAHELRAYACVAAQGLALGLRLGLALAAVCDWSLKDLTAVKDFCVPCLDAEGLILICGFLSYVFLFSLSVVRWCHLGACTITMAMTAVAAISAGAGTAWQ